MVGRSSCHRPERSARSSWVIRLATARMSAHATSTVLGTPAAGVAPVPCVPHTVTPRSSRYSTSSDALRMPVVITSRRLGSWESTSRCRRVRSRIRTRASKPASRAGSSVLGDGLGEELDRDVRRPAMPSPRSRGRGAGSRRARRRAVLGDRDEGGIWPQGHGDRAGTGATYRSRVTSGLARTSTRAQGGSFASRTEHPCRREPHRHVRHSGGDDACACRGVPGAVHAGHPGRAAAWRAAGRSSR